MNTVDKLIENIIEKKNPSVVGLDPDIKRIPKCYKMDYMSDDPFEAVTEVIFTFNKDIIDTISPYVAAVKPQMAFYEKYGSYGVKAFEGTVKYAKSKGLIVIEDAKRNDIGNTAKAYAEGHLGQVELLDGTMITSIDADFLTVTPFLGSDGINPFIEECEKQKKGIFVLVKTSNKSAGEIQDAVNSNGYTISQCLAQYINEKATLTEGAYGYSSIGAVVGATYPEELDIYRKIMPKSYFLVPGFGAQGGSVKDIVGAFNSDGLGAVINSSRGILYDHITDFELKNINKQEYLYKVKIAALKMKDDIYNELKVHHKNMSY